MPTLRQVQNACDAVMTEVLSHVTPKQEVFRGVRTRYWQALETHKAPPAHTTTAWHKGEPDNLDAQPQDELERWEGTGARFMERDLPCSLRVDKYEGPNGRGWELVATFLHNGRVFTRSLQFGPETYRAHDWREEEQPEP